MDDKPLPFRIFQITIGLIVALGFFGAMLLVATTSVPTENKEIAGPMRLDLKAMLPPQALVDPEGPPPPPPNPMDDPEVAALAEAMLRELGHDVEAPLSVLVCGVLAERRVEVFEVVRD